MMKATVRIEQRLDGTVAANWDSQILVLVKCNVINAVQEPRSPAPMKLRAIRPKSQWMNGFQFPSQARAARVNNQHINWIFLLC